MGRFAAQPPANSAVAIPVAREAGRVITLFSPKGGVGRTTLAVNLAVAMASDMGRSVALVDGSFQFGDVGVLLNLNPKNKSIVDVLGDAEGGNEVIDSALISHSTGIRVLLAPPSPEMAELVTVDHIRRIIDRLRATHDLVVVDCWPLFQDSTLALLDMSDLILTLLTLEITNIKNIRLFLEVADQLGYGSEQAASWCSTGPIPPMASASRTSRTRSAARSITRSSPMVGPWSTPSTGACRSCGATSRPRSARTC